MMHNMFPGLANCCLGEFPVCPSAIPRTLFQLGCLLLVRAYNLSCFPQQCIYVKFINMSQIQVNYAWILLVTSKNFFFFNFLVCILIFQGYLHQFESRVCCNQEGLDGGYKGLASGFQAEDSESWEREGLKKNWFQFWPTFCLF